MALKVDPGSNGSVTARFRHCSAVARWYVFGLNVGRIAIARISPVRGSMTSTIPPLAPVVAPRGVQLALGEILHGGVQGQDEPASRGGRLEDGRLPGHVATERVALHQREPRLAGQGLVVGQLDALEPPVVPADEPQHVGRQLPARIEAERLRHRADPRQPAGADGLGDGGGIFTFTHTNGRSLARRCSMSRARSPRCGARAAATAAAVGDAGRQRVHGLDRRAHREGVAVAVEDRPPLRLAGEWSSSTGARRAAPARRDGGSEGSPAGGRSRRREGGDSQRGRARGSGIGTQAPSWSPDEGGGGGRQDPACRGTRPSGRAPAVTAVLPWPAEIRSFPGGRPRRRAVRRAS